MDNALATFTKAYKNAIEVMIHPGLATKTQMGIADALKFYYTIALIPMLFGVLLSLIFGSHHILFALVVVALYLVFFPIGAFINSGIYHIIIKNLFDVYKQEYSAAFLAYIYSLVPVVFFFWVFPIYILGIVLIAVSFLWSFIVLMIAISNLLSMSRLKALGTILLSDIIFYLILYVIAIIILGVFVFVGLFNLFSFNSLNESSSPFNSLNGPTSPLVAAHSSANYTSCSNFTLLDDKFSNTIAGICTWNGGTLNISIAGGDSGYASVAFIGSNNKTYFSQGTTARCLTSFGSFYAPAQKYTLVLSTGRGGGYCGPAIVKLSS